jgi:hypothetical protein
MRCTIWRRNYFTSLEKPHNTYALFRMHLFRRNYVISRKSVQFYKKARNRQKFPDSKWASQLYGVVGRMKNVQCCQIQAGQQHLQDSNKTSKGVFSSRIFFGFDYCSTFVCIY